MVVTSIARVASKAKADPSPPFATAFRPLAAGDATGFPSAALGAGGMGLFLSHHGPLERSGDGDERMTGGRAQHAVPLLGRVHRAGPFDKLRASRRDNGGSGPPQKAATTREN